jgi:hypothetical protein
LIAVLVPVCGAFSPAWAHEGPSSLAFGETPPFATGYAAPPAEAVDRAAPPEPASDAGAGEGAALVAVLAAVWLVRRSPRRAIAVALILLLGLFAFETGLHSVHHGTDKRQLASCPLSGASSHLSAASVDCVAHAGDISQEVGLVPSSEPADPIARPLSAHRGRAPPAFTV